MRSYYLRKAEEKKRYSNISMVVFFLFFLSLILAPFKVYGASEVSNKDEMRAVWVSTVYNIDWPSAGDYNNIEAQKATFVENMNFVSNLNLNTVFFQARGMGDAMYPSSYAPWSKYLTGTQGKNPGYNPLQFALEEAHKKGLEFHAWFNPFRIYVDSEGNTFDKAAYIKALPEGSPLKANPQWIVQYGKYHWLDIGIPEVRAYVTNLILEVVRNYDIDGVHIDDYFYPYKVSGIDFPDKGSYELYGKGFSSVEDWRRENVNTFVRELNRKIKEAKSHVKFGISPFGIWRNSEEVGGCGTNGLSSYDTLYVDSRKWIQEEWIDYIIPQIYWPFDHKLAPHGKLVDWWSKQVAGKNVQLYIGLAAHNVGYPSKGDAWGNPEEIINQIKYGRNNPNVKGSSFFSLKSLKNNNLNIQGNLKGVYGEKVKTPEMPWLGKWTLIDNKWYFLDKNNGKVTGWLKHRNKWYYLGEDGVRRVGWAKSYGSWYYLNSDGTMATSWIKDRNLWYYLEDSGRMATGWKQLGGDWYYLDGSGAMATGWRLDRGKWYYMYSNGIMAKSTVIQGYRLGKDGAWIR